MITTDLHQHSLALHPSTTVKMQLPIHLRLNRLSSPRHRLFKFIFLSLFVLFTFLLITPPNRPDFFPHTAKSLQSNQPPSTYYQPSSTSSTSKTPVYRLPPHSTLPLICAGRPPHSNLHPARFPKPHPTNLTPSFEVLISRYLSPWIPLQFPTTPSTLLHRPITTALLNSMEAMLHGGAFRVRLIGDGQLRYRALEHWPHTYRTERMVATLLFLQRALDRFPDLRRVRAEFYVNVADAPRSTLDSSSRELAGLPIFSFRSSPAFLDIPVPDPVECGSNGNYVWKEKDKLPFRLREPRLIFRGSSSSLQQYHDHNWLSVPRIRLAALAKHHSHLLDAGVTKWIKLAKGVTDEEIQASLGVTLVDYLNYSAQGKFQFILDIDGGLGSSRKRGILSSGAVPFFQNSHWHMWYEPLLRPFYHFLPVDTYLHDLLDRVRAARDDITESQRIVQRANCFAEHVVSENAAALYWKLLVTRYSQLQYDPVSDDRDVSPDMCKLRPVIADGPMGCSNGWYVFNGSLPFGCRYKRAGEYQNRFECWRDIGNGTEFKFTNDPVHSVYRRVGRDQVILLSV